MNMTFSELKHYEGATTTPDDERRHSCNWPAIGAVCGLSLGIVALMLGSLLTLISWLPIAVGGASVKAVGTILLAMTIPLLICGAHCLDLMDRQRDREREKRFHAHE